MSHEEIIDTAHQYLYFDEVAARIVAGEEYFEALDLLCDPDLVEHTFQ